MRTFATPAQLAHWLYPDQEDPTPPTGAEAILRSASIEVQRLIAGAQFDLDDAAEPMPTDPAIRQALQDATCAQAAYFLETGDTSGASSQFQSLSLGAFSASRNVPGGSTAADGPDGSRTAAEAISILRQAGLLVQVGHAW